MPPGTRRGQVICATHGVSFVMSDAVSVLTAVHSYSLCNNVNVGALPVSIFIGLNVTMLLSGLLGSGSGRGWCECLSDVTSLTFGPGTMSAFRGYSSAGVKLLVMPFLPVVMRPTVREC